MDNINYKQLSVVDLRILLKELYEKYQEERRVYEEGKELIGKKTKQNRMLMVKLNEVRNSMKLSRFQLRFHEDETLKLDLELRNTKIGINNSSSMPQTLKKRRSSTNSSVSELLQLLKTPPCKKSKSRFINRKSSLQVTPSSPSFLNRQKKNRAKEDDIYGGICEYKFPKKDDEVKRAITWIYHRKCLELGFKVGEIKQEIVKLDEEIRSFLKESQRILEDYQLEFLFITSNILGKKIQKNEIVSQDEEIEILKKEISDDAMKFALNTCKMLSNLGILDFYK